MALNHLCKVSGLCVASKCIWLTVAHYDLCVMLHYILNGCSVFPLKQTDTIRPNIKPYKTVRIILTDTTEMDLIMMSQPQCPEEIIDGDIMDTMLPAVVTMAMYLIT